MSSVRVAVRCRPFNERERQLGSECIVAMQGNSTLLSVPADRAGASSSSGKAPEPRTFNFDHSFWSHDPADPHFADQAMVYKAIGSVVMADALEGYHSCVFAYGQTGAGKSFSMMGGADQGEQRGLIPRLCEDLFGHIRDNTDATWSAKCEVSYMEIYNERVRDLLNPSNQRKLRVREHATTGPYVEDLSFHAVDNFDMVKALMEEGNKMRTVRATSMNDVSSRSHAIFQLIFTQSKVSREGDEIMTFDRVSKINLVDLAGSERSGQINAGKADRMKEGNVINKSLSTLGKVMTTLAERSSKGKKGMHIPYRESVLTWLLRESLGGNSKTFMLAAISPSAANYDETLSTLRYANQAKRIVNQAVVNEDATATMLRQLNEEIEALRAQLASSRSGAGGAGGAGGGAAVDEAAVAQQLQESEKLMAQLNESWEEKLAKTRRMQQSRLAALRAHGIIMAEGDDDGAAVPLGVMTPRSVPYLINLTHNSLSNQCLVYYIHPGETIVGRHGSSGQLSPAPMASARRIYLDDPAVEPMHCSFRCSDIAAEQIPNITLVPLPHGGRVLVNGLPIKEETVLHAGDCIDIGDCKFNFNNPGEARQSTPSVSNTTSRAESPTSLASRGNSTFALINGHSGGGGGSSSRSGSFASMGNGNSVGGAGRLGSRSALGMPPRHSQTQDELAEQALEEAKAEARFAYSPRQEDALLSHLITNMDSETGPTKLVAAYSMYMIIHHCQTTHGERALRELLVKTATCIKMAAVTARAARDMSMMAFWLANTAELLMVLRRDVSLASTSGEAQVQLTDTAQELFSAILQEAKARFRPAVQAIFMEQGAFAAPPVAVPTPTHTPVRRSAWGISSAASGGAAAGVAGAAGAASGGGSQPQVFDMQYILDSLSALHAMVTSSIVSASVVRTLFASIFYHIGALAFNAIITSKDRDVFCWERGLDIRFNVSRIIDWASTHNLGQDAEAHMAHIVQISQLLQANKSSLAHLDSLCESCFLLNSLQIDRILKLYRPSPDEEKIPATLIDCLKARAMIRADVLAKEDESVHCRVQLERNPDFSLPFRLSGTFHMETGLGNRELLRAITAFMEGLDLTMHDHLPQPVEPPPEPAKKKKAAKTGFFGRWFSRNSTGRIAPSVMPDAKLAGGGRAASWPVIQERGSPALMRMQMTATQWAGLEKIPGIAEVNPRSASSMSKRLDLSSSKRIVHSSV